jgi:hypothetical protein
MADNKLMVPATTIVNTPIGVIQVTPTFVQPVVVTGSVTVVQPITIAQPVDVIIAQSTTATVTAIVVTTSPTVLLVTNLARVGFAVQNTTDIVFVKLDSTCSTALYSYELPKKGILEIENYVGPVTAITATGSVTVMVTEKV